MIAWLIAPRLPWRLDFRFERQTLVYDVYPFRLEVSCTTYNPMILLKDDKQTVVLMNDMWMWCSLARAKRWAEVWFYRNQQLIIRSIPDDFFVEKGAAS